MLARSHRTPDEGEAPFLAADVGGTHVRVGLAAQGPADMPLHLRHYAKYRCADYPGLDGILEDFLREAETPVRRGVIASAGYALDDGSVIAANLPWPLPMRDLQARLGLDELRLINDFQALAHAAAQMDDSRVLHLCGPQDAARGPTLVLGPGTGLGAAVWIPNDGRAVVLPTEAGQAALAVGNELELSLLRQMLRERSHVSIEHVLSGPGLMNLYRNLCRLRGTDASLATPDELTAAAMGDGDPTARESLDVFCGLLGGAVGDMALLYGVQAVYLAGGILPQIRRFLLESRFVERFLDKGPMRGALERVPVRLVEHGQLGVIGAANWYLAALAGR